MLMNYEERPVMCPLWIEIVRLSIDPPVLRISYHIISSFKCIMYKGTLGPNVYCLYAIYNVIIVDEVILPVSRFVTLCSRMKTSL